MSDTFHQYQRLPAELRALIWEFAFEPDDQMALSIFNVDMFHTYVGTFPNLYIDLLLVSREANSAIRAMWHKHGYAWRDADFEGANVNGQQPKEDLAVRRDGKVFSRPWNPEQDALYIDQFFWPIAHGLLKDPPDHRWRRVWERFESKPAAENLRALLPKVKNFALSATDCSYDRALGNMLSMMPNLRAVYIIYDGGPSPELVQNLTLDRGHARYQLEALKKAEGTLVCTTSWEMMNTVNMGELDRLLITAWKFLFMSNMGPWMYHDEQKGVTVFDLKPARLVNATTPDLVYTVEGDPGGLRVGNLWWNGDEVVDLTSLWVNVEWLGYTVNEVTGTKIWTIRLPWRAVEGGSELSVANLCWLR